MISGALVLRLAGAQCGNPPGHHIWVTPTTVRQEHRTGDRSRDRLQCSREMTYSQIQNQILKTSMLRRTHTCIRSSRPKRRLGLNVDSTRYANRERTTKSGVICYNRDNTTGVPPKSQKGRIQKNQQMKYRFVSWNNMSVTRQRNHGHFGLQWDETPRAEAFGCTST